MGDLSALTLPEHIRVQEKLGGQLADYSDEMKF